MPDELNNTPLGTETNVETEETAAEAPPTETTQQTPPQEKETAANETAQSKWQGDVSEAEINDGKLFAILSYFGLFFLPYLMDDQKQNRFTMFHARLGFAAFLVILVLFVFNVIINFIPCIGQIISILTILVVLLPLMVLGIIGIVKAAQGEMWEMPILYDLVKKLGL